MVLPHSDAGDFSLYSASTNSALFWLLSAVADFSPREDAGIPQVRQRHARPAGRGAMGAGVAAIGPGTGRRLPQHDLPGALRPVRLQPPRTHVALPRRRGGHHSHRLRRRNAGAMRQVGHPSVGRDVRMYAAAGLLLATGDCRLRVDFEESYQPLQNDPSYLRSNIYAALLYLRASAGDPERQRAIPSGAPPPRRGGSPGRRASPVPVGRSYVLGLHRSRLPADRRLQRPGYRSGRPPTASRCWPTCTMRWAGTTSRWLT